ncbi:hypothetical protein K439DRAFT_1642631 [Ramaria rubella]|nr:hypothetical protein K439DRAFT_1642631 [Ramaria rubella]
MIELYACARVTRRYERWPGRHGTRWRIGWLDQISDTANLVCRVYRHLTSPVVLYRLRYVSVPDPTLFISSHPWMDICAPMITLYPGYARRRSRGLDRLSSEPPRCSLSPAAIFA